MYLCRSVFTNSCCVFHWHQAIKHRTFINCIVVVVVVVVVVVEGKVQPKTCRESTEWKYSSALSLTSALDGSEQLTPLNYRCFPGNGPVPIVCVAA